MQTLHFNSSDIYQGSLLLVNHDHPLQKTYEPRLTIYHNHLLQPQVIQLLQKCLESLNALQDIVMVSGYRSFKEQTQLYHQSLKEHDQEFTQKYVALPRCSEHETGLAIDLAHNQDDIDVICPDFPYEGITQKVREKLYSYGFIERYSEYKQSITHIAKEPWHFRYVGYPHSCIIRDLNMCLEEYHDFIKQFSIYSPYTYAQHGKVFDIFYVPVNKDISLTLRSDAVYQVSGNNMDGVIVTVWRRCL